MAYHRIKIITSKKVNIKRYLLTFNSFEDVIGCVKFLKGLKSSILYRLGKEYRLIVYTKQPINFFIIKEFCTAIIKDSTEFSQTEEYGKYIYGRDAVEKINKAFNKL